ECNGGDRIHGLDERGNIKQWECNHDNERRNEKGMEMSFSDLLLIKYGNSKIDGTSRVIDCFEEESETSKDPYSRSLEEYKWVFVIEIEQLVDEYKLGIGTKGYILDDIWEKCEQVHGETTYPWHDEGFEEEER
nr:phospholipase-like protein [Tanacetum cinerariifolium]